ncbi:hypothetical protein [Paenibacillus sp. IITD108]|uniref:hypothetical protein n=1 Tax=Paenibacillus sp. IITD108 TaxID=3116649 RepID=UPI002F4117BC
MDKQKIMIGIVLVLMLSSATYFVYQKVSGWEHDKEEFKQNVELYLKSEYPNVILKNHTTEYGFKEMKYYSVLTSNDDVVFVVQPSYYESFQCNYFIAKWEKVLNDEIVTSLQRAIPLDATIKVIISLTEDEARNNSVQFNVNNFLEKNGNLTEIIIGYYDKEISEELIEKSYEVIKWMGNQNYNMNFFIQFKDRRHSIQIALEDITKINKWEDLKQFMGA